MTKVALVFKKSRFDLYSHSNEGETRAFAEGNRELIENDAKHQRTLDAVIQFFDQSGISHELFYRGELRGSGYDHVEEVRFRNLMRHGALVIDPRHQCNDVPIGAEVVLRLGDPLMVYGDLMKQRTIFLEKQGIY